MKLYPLVALALSLACSSSPTGTSAAAIIGGDADTTTTGVVLIYIHGTSESSAWAGCSGTVVSPHVVVTAAHCLDPSLNGIGPGAEFQVFLGQDIWATNPPSDYYAVTKTAMDPAFSYDTLTSKGHDVGVIVTGRALPVPPIAFARTPLDASLIGQPTRLVGFGLTDRADASSDGQRNSGSTTIAALDDIQVTTAAALPSGCEGDSGGAMLVTLGGVETLVGAISHGVALQDCESASIAERIDISDSFIEPFIDESDPGFLPPITAAGDAAADAASLPAPPAQNQGCSASGANAGSGCWVLLAATLFAARRRRLTPTRACRGR